MTDHSETAWEQDEIESHLRSAMDALTPNVFDKIDLSTPQEIYVLARLMVWQVDDVVVRTGLLQGHARWPPI